VVCNAVTIGSGVIVISLMMMIGHDDFAPRCTNRREFDVFKEQI
jgi:hypothetical protein